MTGFTQKDAENFVRATLRWRAYADHLEDALRAVVEILETGGNGEGWTVQDAVNIAKVAASEAEYVEDEYTPEQIKRMDSIMGDDWALSEPHPLAIRGKVEEGGKSA